MNEHKPRQLNLKDAEIYALAAEERYAALVALAGSYRERAGPRTMSDEDAVGYDAFGAPN